MYTLLKGLPNIGQMTDIKAMIMYDPQYTMRCVYIANRTTTQQRTDDRHLSNDNVRSPTMSKTNTVYSALKVPDRTQI